MVQEIFLTETRYHADVILPATAWPEKVGTVTNTDRMGIARLPGARRAGRREAGSVDHPGNRAQDGVDWNYGGLSDVFNEMRKGMNSIAGASRGSALEREGCVTYPCENEGDPGEPVVFIDKFPTPTGRARPVPADIIPAAEQPDREFPFVLITGRQLEHWHTGAITSQGVGVLDAIEPNRWPLLHPLDLDEIGAQPGEVITVESRRGIISLLRARRRRHAARRGVRSVLFLRSGGEPADQPGARPGRQDTGVQSIARLRSCAAGSSCRVRVTAAATRSRSWKRRRKTI